MDLNRVYGLLAICLASMPDSYPKPRLIIHESPESLVAFLGDERYAFQLANRYPAALVAGMADLDRNAIHLPYETIATNGPDNLINILTHEIGHLYYGQKHGKDSDQYVDEALANAFQRRWCKRISARIQA